MKTTLTLASALLLSSALVSQVTIKGATATDWGNTASVGSNKASDSEKKDTVVGDRGLRASSYVRGGAYATSYANDSVYKSRWTGKTHVTAVASDRGSLSSWSSSNKSSCNTTGNAGAKGPHSVAWKMQATKATKGTLTVYVSASASTGGAASTKVTIGTKSWMVKAGEKAKRVSMDMTIGTTATMITIENMGAASLTGRGRKGYSSYGSVSFVYGDSTTRKCTITDGVKGCGPVLKATASGTTVTANLSGAAKSAWGLMLMSGDGKTVGTCPLFTGVVGLRVFRTSTTGTARHILRLPNRDLKLSILDVVLSFDKSFSYKSSNSLNIVCK